jgi:pimeloyl-ACP methyl ester carboxylesterase
MPTIERGKRRLWFETTGDDNAPPLLLIMGMGFSSRAWGSLPKRLAEHYRVITFDNRGTGRSTGTGFGFLVKDMAADAAAVLDAAGAGRAFAFGISMGGMAALELALRHPERVRALVLGATFASWLKSRKPAVSVVSDLVVGGVLSRAGSHRLLGHALVSMEHLRADLEGFSSWIASGERASPRVLLQQMTAITLHGAMARLPELRTPTLILTGDRDRLIPAENSRRLAEAIPGARLVLLPGAGHCFPLERFDDTCRELRRFFSEVARAEDSAEQSRGRRT